MITKFRQYVNGISVTSALHWKLLLSLLMVLVAFGIQVPSAQAATVTFSDGTFNSADWSMTIFKTDAPSSGSFAQVVSDGNPGAYQQITHVLAGTPNIDIRTIHIKTSASYNPQAQGPLASIDYSEDARTDSTEFNTFGGSSGPALKQNGMFYTDGFVCTQPDCSGDIILPTPPPTPWTPISFSGLTAASFCLVTSGNSVDCSQNPDFSTSGSTIQFGYARANTHTGFATFTRITGIDTWIVTINLAPLSLTGPTPGMAGQNNTFDVSGATPGKTVHFVGGPPSGSTNVPGCPGEAIDIGSPKLLGTAVADAAGNASLTVAVPAVASGITARFQAVEASSCRVSNLMVFSFP